MALVTVISLAALHPAAAADNPFAPNQVTSSDTVTWRKQTDDHWTFDDARLRPVVGESGKIAGVLSGRKLVVLKPDGTPEPHILTLEKDYLYVGLRPNYVVAVTGGTSEIEFLDRKTGKPLRTASLGDGEPLSFQLHPTLPIAYVSMSRKLAINEKFSLSGFFVVVDELKAVVHGGDEFLGRTLVVDPSGRFLIGGYADIIELGSEIVRGPVERFRIDPAPQPRPGPNVPGPNVLGPTRPVPGRPIIPALPRGYGARPRGYDGRIVVLERSQRVTKAAKISLMIVYDIEDDFAPQKIGIFEFKDFERGLRLSSDGRRLTGLSSNPIIEAIDPLDPKATATTYDAGTVGFGVPGTDLIHHPSIPVSAIVASDKIDFLDTETGKPLSSAGASTAPISGGAIERHLGFTPDGNYALIVEHDAGRAARLVRVAVPLTSDLSKDLAARVARKAASPVTGALVPLVEFDGFRGGLAGELRASEIAKRYTKSVVVVRSNEGSGTGFVVGSSGYILTCAHCVSRLTPTTVVYRLPSSDEELEAEAVVLQRDVKLDIALLKITPKSTLSAVVFAAPVETSHGEEVTVISNPVLGDTVLKNSITTGVVSHAAQAIDEQSYIQSSAAVNPGSSGGPMFDQHGRAIGMVVLKARIDGVGFAIPVRRLTEFLLRSAKFTGDDGQLVRHWVDDAQKSEQQGAFVKYEADKLTLAGEANDAPRQVEAAKLSGGDRALLQMIGAAASGAKTPEAEASKP